MDSNNIEALETIVAIATPPGKGGVGIIRISGEKSHVIAKQITSKSLQPRYASFAQFLDSQGGTIDSGIAIFFENPHSFTGENVVELQGHGGPIILQMLLARVIELGARQAKPGEFSERAFLNNKIDLAQAEAIADLIESSSHAAAKSAMRSLQGEFSEAVNALLAELINIRMYVESAIDFPEEEIDFLGDGVVLNKINNIQQQIHNVQKKATSGQLLQNGYRIVLAGKPNAGKSTLMNALSGFEASIVTEIEGTTRDSITTTLDFDGLPVYITDTAGLRDSDDVVEKIGVQRARQLIKDADHILLLLDVVDKDKQENLNELLVQEQLECLDKEKLTIVYTKLDTVDPNEATSMDLSVQSNCNLMAISAKTGVGIEDLKQHVKQLAGFNSEESNVFSARARHLDAIDAALAAIERGKQQLLENQAGELLAYELLTAQNALSLITGEFNADDLLGEIFSNFCIGK